MSTSPQAILSSHNAAADRVLAYLCTDLKLDLPLAAAQDLVARALGSRDWQTLTATPEPVANLYYPDLATKAGRIALRAADIGRYQAHGVTPALEAVSLLVELAQRVPLGYPGLISTFCDSLSTPGFHLTERQSALILAVLQHSFCAVSGREGAGKATAIKALTDLFERRGLKVLNARALPKTVAALWEMLEPNGDKLGRNLGRPLECDLLILDEKVFNDIVLLNNLLLALPAGCRVLLVIDIPQEATAMICQVADRVRARTEFPHMQFDRAMHQFPAVE